MNQRHKPQIDLSPLGAFRLDGKEISKDEARRHWDQWKGADWTQGAFQAMSAIVLANIKPESPKP